MPNRLIKEGIRTSRQIGGLDDFTFRTWTYLITYVDDYGRGSADPELLKGFLFARRKGTTEKNISDALDKLACAGLIQLYEVDGEPFLYFPTWAKHQRIQTKCSKFPEPTAENVISQESTVSHGEPPLESNPIRIQSESNPNGNRAPAHKHGMYQNVLLTDEDMRKLQAEFPGDWQQRIDRLSEYMASTGKSYKDHLATIRAWARKDGSTVTRPVKPGDIHGCSGLGDAELDAIRQIMAEDQEAAE